ncbi:hypothetical protein CI610_03642 [invertebrate metagenome]|uniref:Uncharacterized protein n=1 Tax=invertebrate metagenome TaxID=1711999 RepID=A0A2H9T2J4_9ZZZZ
MVISDTTFKSSNRKCSHSKKIRLTVERQLNDKCSIKLADNKPKKASREDVFSITVGNFWINYLPVGILGYFLYQKKLKNPTERCLKEQFVGE